MEHLRHIEVGWSVQKWQSHRSEKYSTKQSCSKTYLAPPTLRMWRNLVGKMIADVAGTAGKMLGWEWLGQMRRLDCLVGPTGLDYCRVGVGGENGRNEVGVIVAVVRCRGR